MTPAERRTVWLALACAALADALLAPFYPQFFAEAFGSSALLTPGLYIALCRIAIGVSLPIWTRWAKRIPPLRLVAIAQGLAGTTGLLCAAAPSLASFLALSFLTESTRAAYLMLYPVLVSDAAPERRSHVVVRGAALLHAAALISALVGGLLLSTLGGRAALVMAAAMDFAQLALLWRIARRAAPTARAAELAVDTPADAPADAPGDAADAVPASAPPLPRDAGPAAMPLPLLLAIGFLTTFAFVLLRPYFTLFLHEGLAPGASLPLLGAIFVLPSAVAVLSMPFVRRLVAGPHVAAWLLAATALLALTSFGQIAAPTLALLIAVRLIYGLAAYGVDVCLDHAVLCTGDDAFARWGWIAALQSGAIVVAPLAAAALVGAGGYLALFLVAALVAAIAALLAAGLRSAVRRSR
jgi:MFS family permease